ncbi:hypothetical protein B484DRAFT_440105 [Ochromonadaceae sp. CCMP2298]|nr:hypothetical protein B484DRAFT_440105 [Ochromonadaceae sp. CCMP2298]
MSSAADKLKKERGRKYAKDNYDKNKEEKKKKKKASKAASDKNPAKKQATVKAWREVNVDKLAVIRKNYQENNVDRLKEDTKNYRENNQDKIKNYREKNQDKIKNYREKNQDKIQAGRYILKELRRMENKEEIEKNPEKAKHLLIDQELYDNWFYLCHVHEYEEFVENPGGGRGLWPAKSMLLSSSCLRANESMLEDMMQLQIQRQPLGSIRLHRHTAMGRNREDLEADKYFREKLFLTYLPVSANDFTGKTVVINGVPLKINY